MTTKNLYDNSLVWADQNCKMWAVWADEFLNLYFLSLETMADEFVYNLTTCDDSIFSELWSMYTTIRNTDN